MTFFESIILNYLLAGLIISFGINLIFFIIAISNKTDKVTDLSYSFTFLTIAAYYLFQVEKTSLLHLIPSILVIIWSIRLGSYLFIRILKIKHDERFKHMHEKPLKFAGFWILQAITVWIVLLPLTIYYSNESKEDNIYICTLGLLIWLIGFVIEVVSDYQKFKFKKHNKNRWIDTGIWKYSRHPNYFGESFLWWGLFIYSINSLTVWTLLGFIGPMFITLMLLYFSGIPLLEKKADSRYGNDPEYQRYKSGTNRFLPWFKKKITE